MQMLYTWHQAFLDRVVPSLPCFGYDYWPKFIYGDIGNHITDGKADLMRYTLVGIGCRTLLHQWGLSLPRSGRKAQAAGLEAICELQKCVAAVIESHKHVGIEIACQDAGLRPLTAYDVQVQCCECKRGHSLHGRIAKARALL